MSRKKRARRRNPAPTTKAAIGALVGAGLTAAGLFVVAFGAREEAQIAKAGIGVGGAVALGAWLLGGGGLSRRPGPVTEGIAIGAVGLAGLNAAQLLEP